MTLIEIDRAAGSHTHALVIGVGSYSSCRRLLLNDDVGAESAALARRFGPLRSPKPSAERIVEWLLREQTANPVAPLGSIEVLASEKGGSEVTFKDLARAFDGWFARCDLDSGNVALFFFVGHGAEYAGNHALLLDDVGESPNRFFENAIHLERTVRAMSACRAETQCYFIDACRTTPDELLEQADLDARSLRAPRLLSASRDAPIYFATGVGSAAYGDPHGISPFTAAVLESLSGAAAHPPSVAGRWEIRTDQLIYAINELLSWHRPAGEPSQRAEMGNVTTGSVLRALPRAPKVPFRLGIRPRQALSAAHLSLEDYRDRSVVLHREPRDDVWEDAVSAGSYRLRARFGRARYREYDDDCPLFPPCVHGELEVKAR